MSLSTDTFYHRRRNLVSIILLLVIMLVVFLFAIFAGPGSDPASSHPTLALVAGVSLAALAAVFAWVLWHNPKALVIDEKGIDIPFAFGRPLPWKDIHRIRRVAVRGVPYGRRDWLIIDPSPGVLAPLRLPLWRRLELWFQARHGIRIPLHGLEGDPEEVVRSIERFRPVVVDGD